MLHPVKSLGCVKCAARAAPELLKAPAILLEVSITTVRRTAIDREDLKPNWIQKARPHLSR